MHEMLKDRFEHRDTLSNFDNPDNIVQLEDEIQYDIEEISSEEFNEVIIEGKLTDYYEQFSNYSSNQKLFLDEEPSVTSPTPSRPPRGNKRTQRKTDDMESYRTEIKQAIKQFVERKSSAQEDPWLSTVTNYFKINAQRIPEPQRQDFERDIMATCFQYMGNH
jgi:hypothetical protein